MTKEKHIVYRYTDITDGVIKYVGITHESGLKQRIKCHRSQDAWKYKGAWVIEYFVCENQSEAEAFESHLIALYGTGKYFNKHKRSWGLNKYLPDIEDRWVVYEESVPTNTATVHAIILFKYLLRHGMQKEAHEIFNCFEFEGIDG